MGFIRVDGGSPKTLNLKCSQADQAADFTKIFGEEEESVLTLYKEVNVKEVESADLHPHKGRWL